MLLEKIIEYFDEQIAVGYCPNCKEKKSLWMTVLEIGDKKYLQLVCADCGEQIALLG